MTSTYHFSHTSTPCAGRILARDESLIARYFRSMHERASKEGTCHHCWLHQVVPGYRFCPACCHTTYAEMPPAYHRELAINERC